MPEINRPARAAFNFMGQINDERNAIEAAV
jgi:hypothetical protein